MNSDLKTLLLKVESGEISVDDAIASIDKFSYVDIEDAKVDIGRRSRQGSSEVIYGEGKTVDQIASIIKTLQGYGQTNILITRLSIEKSNELSKNVDFRFFENSRIGIVGDIPKPNGAGYILVCSGGTSDIPVAEEAAITAEFMGNDVHRVFDVGVAGIHRLLRHSDEIEGAACIIVVAGMEGALASVVGGIAKCPVVAVPTSVGYGASFGGLSALLSMLNSCASGVSVVNIDNGFGAGVTASRINHPAYCAIDDAS